MPVLSPLLPDQDALVPSTQAGTYYIMVYVRDLPSGTPSQNITLLAEATAFLNREHDTGYRWRRRQGNRYTNGAGFRDTTRVFLRIAPDTLVEGKVVEFLNTMELKIRWDLSSVPLGTYDIVAENLDTPQQQSF